MGSIFEDGGQEVLFAIPTRPPDFFNLTENGAPGKYILGHDKFLLENFHIVGVLRRSIGPAEEFLLGVLSVFLIAVVSEIVHVYLLRTNTERRLSPTSVIYACLVDELSHFRNIWSHLSAVRRRNGNDTRSLTTRQRATASLMVIGITLFVFAAEVVAVVLTQPITVNSKKHDYNIKGVQPMGTSRGVARYIRRVAGDRTCVSPILTRGHQPRNFIVSACSILDTDMRMAEDSDVSDEITVGSWYHYGGSDYNVTFGDTFFRLRLRSELFLDAIDGGSRRIYFDNLDNENMDHARYIQERFIYASMEWACNKNFSKKTCQELVDELEVVDRRKEERDIELWRRKKASATEKVTGLVTTFRVGMNAPWRAMNSGIREFYASAALLEVTGKVRYENIMTDKVEDGIPGLISEEGRVAGVLLLVIILGILMSLLFAIRRFFRPISIAHMAMRHVGDDVDTRTDIHGITTELSWDAISEAQSVQQGSAPDTPRWLFPAIRSNRESGRARGLPDSHDRGAVSRMDSVSTWDSEVV